MSHSYSSNRVHLIFSTKNREKRISDALQPKLWPYMAGIARNHGFEAIKIGGVKDHVHCLLLIPPAIPLAKAVQILKPAPQNGSMIRGRLVGISPGRKAMARSASAPRTRVES